LGWHLTFLGTNLNRDLGWAFPSKLFIISGQVGKLALGQKGFTGQIKVKKGQGAIPQGFGLNWITLSN